MLITHYYQQTLLLFISSSCPSCYVLEDQLIIFYFISSMADSQPRRLMPKHDKYNSKCVCEICTCGLHKCPRGRSMRPRFQAQTTNQEFFTQKQLEKRPIFQPNKPVQTNYDPDVLKSSYKSQFTGLPALKPTPDTQSSNKSNVERKKAPFYAQTSYKSTYDKKQIEFQPKPKFQYKPKDTKFQGSSSYKSDFQPLKPSDSQPNTVLDSKLSADLFNKKRIPFQGQSAYKQQFQKHMIQSIPNRLASPPARKDKPETKFEGSSTYKNHFQQPQVQTFGKQQQCPVLQMPRVPREPSPGKQHINFSAEKNVWE